MGLHLATVTALGVLMHLTVLTLLATPTTAWMHGQPEPDRDDPSRTQSASEMLRRLWGAARERADESRKQRAQAEQQGVPYAPSNADMFAGLMDYAKQKLDRPPLLQVERNLQTLHRHQQILARHLVRLIRSEAIDPTNPLELSPELQTELDVLHEIVNSTLVPVQAEKYTIL